MPAPITRSLGHFASALTFADIPQAARDTIILGMTDCVGVMFAGIDVASTRIVHDVAANISETGEARVYLGRGRASAPDTALVNSTAAHAVVLDDVALGGGHPSSVLVPAILAEAEALDLGGEDAMRAYAAGYETWAGIFACEQDAYTIKGWHQTAVIGPVACAAAIASLRRLAEPQATAALGIAASMAAGITANFLFDTKAFQVGRASAAGITAARLAAAGMTASDSALERRGGLLGALSPNGRLSIDTPLTDLGTVWQLELVGLNIKRYPFFNATHRALDGIFSLIAEHGLKPSDIAGITVMIGPVQAAARARSDTAASFIPPASIELAMAAAVLAGEATLVQLTEAFHTRPDVRAMMAKVQVAVVEDIPPDSEPNLGFSSRVRLELRNGTRIESLDRLSARGHHTLKLTTDELWAKFAACMTAAGAGGPARALFDALQQLDRREKIRSLPSSGI